MLTLHLVRHGDTLQAAEGIFCGDLDPPLTANGLAQAERVALAAKPLGVSALYCSPKLRARTTVAPIARVCGLEPKIEENLREISYGSWEGRFEAEIRREAGGHALRVSSPSSVRVNGKLISGPVLLSEGDEIGIGDRVLRYTRQPQPDALPVSTTVLVTESLELALREPEENPYSRFGSRPSAVALRNPMRAVAFVSSVIAAVAIATLVIMHRGP